MAAQGRGSRYSMMSPMVIEEGGAITLRTQCHVSCNFTAGYHNEMKMLYELKKGHRCRMILLQIKHRKIFLGLIGCLLSIAVIAILVSQKNESTSI